MINDVVPKRSSFNPFEKIKIPTRNLYTIFVLKMFLSNFLDDTFITYLCSHYDALLIRSKCSGLIHFPYYMYMHIILRIFLAFALLLHVVDFSQYILYIQLPN